ncbi:MAG TPA: hypothetical protein VKA84_20125 [Gemmatimonadaceae bacterium]|nr:hypothetical protein [Gemmatimonadaceae bacterium]
MIRRLFHPLVERLQGWARTQLGEVHDVRGFRVVVENTRPDIATPDVLARLDEALGLIERYQPWRLRHLRRDLRQFWVVRYPCRGAYLPAERSCMTELTFLARRDITAAPVASSIVHEGMHARVHRMGVREEGRDRAREERLCRRAELDFGLALPPELGAPVVERARDSLALADEEVAPAIDWAEAARRTAAVDQQAAAADRPRGPA